MEESSVIESSLRSRPHTPTFHPFFIPVIGRGAGGPTVGGETGQSGDRTPTRERGEGGRRKEGTDPWYCSGEEVRGDGSGASGRTARTVEDPFPRPQVMVGTTRPSGVEKGVGEELTRRDRRQPWTERVGSTSTPWVVTDTIPSTLTLSPTGLRLRRGHTRNPTHPSLYPTSPVSDGNSDQ